MNKPLFWCVDMQSDFVYEDGLLPVPGATGIQRTVFLLNNLAMHLDADWVASADDHEYTDDEITLGEADPANGLFNPHCMRGTLGAALVPEASRAGLVPLPLGPLPARLCHELFPDGPVQALLLKKHFDVFTNPHAEALLDRLQPVEVILFGVATDVCVRAAFEGLVQRGHRVSAVKDAMAGLDTEYCNTLLTGWAAEDGVQITTTAEIVRRFQ